MHPGLAHGKSGNAPGSRIRIVSLADPRAGSRPVDKRIEETPFGAVPDVFRIPLHPACEVEGDAGNGDHGHGRSGRKDPVLEDGSREDYEDEWKRDQRQESQQLDSIPASRMVPDQSQGESEETIGKAAEREDHQDNDQDPEVPEAGKRNGAIIGEQQRPEEEEYPYEGCAAHLGAFGTEKCGEA